MFPYAGITQFKLKGMFSAPNPGAPLTNELNRLFYRLLAEPPVRVNTNFHVSLIPIFKRGNGLKNRPALQAYRPQASI